jgi:hypothetical protein
MTLGTNARGLRAVTTLLACAGLALSPAAARATATAKPKPRKSVRELRNTKPKTVAKKPKAIAKRQATADSTGLGNRIGLAPGTQLAAMNTALAAAPSYFSGRSTGCAAVVPMLALQPGQVLGGNFRDSAGGCYVWLNLGQSSMLTGSEICKIGLHEYGHLTGLEHSEDQNDVMFAPFQSDPIPGPCLA